MCWAALAGGQALRGEVGSSGQGVGQGRGVMGDSSMTSLGRAGPQ